MRVMRVNEWPDSADSSDLAGARKRLVGWLVGCCWVACCWATEGSEWKGARNKAGRQALNVPVHGWKEWGGMQVQHMSRDDANGIHAHLEATHLYRPSDYR